ncbi:hypothetical protein AYM40_29575 [Paraburkholderia phytofirmans OLGA172]|uniref:OmpR/PhoB-type domain-containing protein n=1 Tax=Paraburkholderia phytofirmans OLGA172 TaxID=1417228 RepID=A0A160FU39_9BURK|nr:winged helix-turn-helix domain-containing protein [Paraburkholderia phytofirmans]ANB76386.1 hypothetical protein AYM40_29575 [Paraburkholderia phytofirmans OLGA172]
MVQIGHFELDTEMRTLRCGAGRVRIGARAFDILAYLAAFSGRLVTKDELIRHVWPDTIVEENNLQVHLSALRKALGVDRDLIITLTGRGYQLAGRQEQQPQTNADIEVRPQAMGELFGRDVAFREIANLLGQARAVTLVGAGGIGKTSLATAVARNVADRFADGVHFVALAAHADAATVLVAVAEACGLVFAGGTITAARIATALAGKQCLLILDNAEHVIDAVASLTDVLTRHSPILRILTTSREPLRVAAESIYRVQSLDVPAKGDHCEDVLAHSAVRLFLHRVRMLQPRISEDAASVSLVGEVCRRLDGIPLAIELAAACAATLGIDGLHRRLDDRLTVLTGGCRTALPRHQTLRATFDWSYATLDPVARAVFRRLGQFASTFLIDDACAVAADDAINPMLVATSVGELAEKSLLGVEFEDTLTRYWLPESTRAYAREKLQDEGETPAIAAAHARWLQRRFGESGGLLTTHVLTREAPDHLRDALDDARSVLEWAFSPEGDQLLGIELTGTLVEALLAWSLIEECCTRAGRAVTALETLPAGTVDAACELRLRSALASALLLTRGPVSEANRLWLEVLSLAVQQHNDEFQARALWGLFNATLAAGRIRASLKYATLLQMLAGESGDDLQAMLADQLVCVSLCWLGEHTYARTLVERGLTRLGAHQQEMSHTVGFRVDTVVVATANLARILWVQGYPDEAMALIDAMVNSVRSDMGARSLSDLLGDSAVSLALLSGDLPTAARYLDILRTQATQHRLEIWQACCDCLSGRLDILSGRTERGLEMLETALAALRAGGFSRISTSMASAWAEALAHAGSTTEARRILDETLAYCNEGGNHLFTADIWRVLGVISMLEARAAVLRRSSPTEHETRAQTALLHAIEIAQRQGARMWELRAAIPLAQLWHSQGRDEAARQVLGSLCALFPKTSVSLDVRTAHALLGELDTSGAKGDSDVPDVTQPKVAQYDGGLTWFASAAQSDRF